MRKLIWAFAVRIFPKTRFRMARPVCRLTAVRHCPKIRHGFVNILQSPQNVNFKVYYLSYLLDLCRDKWPATPENAPPDICVRQRFNLACAFAQSDQSLRCPHEETLHPWLFKMRAVRDLIILSECAGWSESSWSGDDRWYVFWYGMA